MKPFNPPTDKAAVKWFINFYEAIPDEKWCIGNFYRTDNGVFKNCALGHIGAPKESPEREALETIFREAGLCIPAVNDGTDNGYQQPTPKGRILAALYDILHQINFAGQSSVTHTEPV
jgi:hypothetical protein